MNGRIIAAVLCAAFWFAVPAWASSSPETATARVAVACLSPAGEAEDLAERVLALVNEAREKNGLEPLELMDDLTSAALLRAEEIAARFSHTRPNGEPGLSLITEGALAAGENIAAGFDTPERVVRRWLESPDHRENILNGDYREMGVGYLFRPGSQCLHYWVQLFRLPEEDI